MDVGIVAEVTRYRYRPSAESSDTTAVIEVDCFVTVTPERCVFFGQPGLGLLHTVLHIHRANDVLVIANFKRYLNGGRAVIGARRGHVDHALDTIDLFFNESGDDLPKPLALKHPSTTAETVTCGGVTSGYCAMGSTAIDTADPARIMTSDTTVAKMGRSNEEVNHQLDFESVVAEAVDLGRWRWRVPWWCRPVEPR